MSLKGIVSALEFVYNLVTKTALFIAAILFLALIIRDCREDEKKVPVKWYDTEPDLTSKKV